MILISKLILQKPKFTSSFFDFSTAKGLILVFLKTKQTSKMSKRSRQINLIIETEDFKRLISGIISRFNIE